MLPPIAPFFSPKGVLREKLKAERRRAYETRSDAPLHAARYFLDHIDIPKSAVVSLFHSMGDELDTTPLIAALDERGIRLALPAVARKKSPLVFRQYRPGDRLAAGGFGTSHPEETAGVVVPDILVVPLLGFSRNGDRLGYGGGYYDRTLEALREKADILAVGYAYAAQEVDALPVSPLDQPLDWIVTEREAIKVGVSKGAA